VDDTAAKDRIGFTAGSYARPAVKQTITAGWAARMDPLGNGTAVIRITAGYSKTVGESPGGK
jgi:hypothetical protein